MITQYSDQHSLTKLKRVVYIKAMIVPKSYTPDFFLT